jgi:hypothetical protein
MALKKVLAFDSWTEGSRHFQRLLPALQSSGLSLKLVHLGSWGNEPQRPKQETIGQLEVRDIAAYPDGSFERMLDIEKPDAVILLSTATFAHRAFLRYCKQRSIPSLHLYHGLMSVQVTEDHKGSVKINRIAYFKYVLSRLEKLIRKTFPCYVKALVKTNASFQEWMRFVYDVAKLASGLPIWQPNVAEDARTTKCAVFTEIDRHHAHRVYRLALRDVVAVGNPDLIWFGVSQEMLASYTTAGSEGRKTEIMYLDTGLAMQGLVFQDLQAFINHLCSTSLALEAQGFKMNLKAHPAHDQQALKKLLAKNHVEVVSSEDFIPRLRRCAACIVEISSVNVIPALMGIPLLYANYGPLKELRFGPVLMSYPRGQILRDLAEVRGLLDGLWKKEDAGLLKDWIAENAGPLPAEAMPERVAELLSAMMASPPATMEVRDLSG